jgi:hypothetical protein
MKTPFNPKGLCALALVVAGLGYGQTGQAQGVQPLTDKDREELAAMSVTYRRALMNCKGDDYADLFATPGGYFGSSSRGEVREHKALAEMVVGYDRCKQAPPANPGAVAGQRGSAYPAPVYEATSFGAKARIINSKGGGYYDDEYVKTPKGWRFKSRNVVADAELAAKLTTQDFIEIRTLAGDDHGYYEDLYGDHHALNTPRGKAFGPDDRPFRSSGLQLTVTPEGGITGLAYIRNNGGHYEDVYTKTAQGWRIKERKYVPPTAGGTK